MLLSIAGYDPSGGAGTILDLQVFRYFGFAGAGIITALTAQNSHRIDKDSISPADFLKQQYNTLDEDVSLQGIKIGLIGAGKNLPVIKQIIRNNRDIPIVVDPVLKSSSGTWFLEQNAFPDFIRTFSGASTLETPNVRQYLRIKY